MSEVTYLKDYKAHPFKIESVNLTFELTPTKTKVTSHLKVNRKSDADAKELYLDGEQLTLVELELDGQKLTSEQVEVTESGMTIFNVPASFELHIITEINPEANTDLEGLFISGKNYCTQCEPFGFRRITYFIDRPDNLSLFTTTLIADKQQYPFLLSNGNCIDKGDLKAGKHFATWQDPYLKPSYLFALVAGKFDLLEDQFVTKTGRKVELKLYVDPGELEKAQHAMSSLKLAMRWDELTYGREYDLDIFMIVAVRDFNMGAMENKGLNIFNSKYILANPETATDSDYENILMVVGHEYFHNWSGNRVTCRDWFQLSLKEGFTVFRDQTFTADHVSEAVKRIDDIDALRIHQFAEDAGPTAHPIQPQSYLEMNNFYTVTVYNKGAEVVRMLHTMLGADTFRKATDLYFDRHDGQAVTIEEFITAMEDASGCDLTQFRLWYVQAGTPQLTVKDDYDPKKEQYSLIIEQNIPATPDQENKQVMHIPLAVGLLDKSGKEIVATRVLDIVQKRQTFTFDHISEHPLPSLLRKFSAPVKLDFAYNQQQLCVLLAHDTDIFTRYEAAQQLALHVLAVIKQNLRHNNVPTISEEYLSALRLVCNSDNDKSLTALLLALPSEKYMLGLEKHVDPVLNHQAREILRLQIAENLQPELTRIYQENSIDGEYVNNAEDNGKRRLKNTALSYLTLRDKGKLAWQQFNLANNMTDSLAALTCLANTDCAQQKTALDDFYQKWQKDANVLDKWFAVQASSSLPGALQRVNALMECKAYDGKNPNAIRALIGSFAMNNLAQFHATDGSGYQFLTEQIISLDKINKHVSARLVNALLDWHRYDTKRQDQMRQSLQMILATDGLSKNTRELVEKALA